MSKYTSGAEHRELPGLAEARRLLKARKGAPTEADRPRRQGKPPRVHDRQLDIFGHTHRVNGAAEQEEPDAA